MTIKMLRDEEIAYRIVYNAIFCTCIKDQIKIANKNIQEVLEKIGK